MPSHSSLASVIMRVASTGSHSVVPIAISAAALPTG